MIYSFAFRQALFVFLCLFGVPLLAAKRSYYDRVNNPRYRFRRFNDPRARYRKKPSDPSFYRAEQKPIEQTDADRLKAAQKYRSRLSGFRTGREFQQAINGSITSKRSHETYASLFYLRGTRLIQHPWNAFHLLSPWYPMFYSGTQKGNAYTAPNIDIDSIMYCSVKFGSAEVLSFRNIPSDALIIFSKQDSKMAILQSSLNDAAEDIYKRAYNDKKLRVEVEMQRDDLNDNTSVKVRNYITGEVVSELSMSGFKLCNKYYYKSDSKEWNVFAAAVLVASGNASYEKLLSYLDPKPTEGQMVSAETQVQQLLFEADQADMAEDERAFQEAILKADAELQE